ncbi:MAG: hypothetical protein ACRDQA_24395, partial [Nocardioidaceae bacterium]
LFGATVAAFLAGEGHAFATRDEHGTLTYWSHTRITRHPVGRAVWWVAMGWITVHLATGRYGLPWRWDG